MAGRQARVVTFLAPNMLPVYEWIIARVSAKLRYPMELFVGSRYAELAGADFSFICGLPYVLRTAPRMEPSVIAALVAPVLAGERYQNRPIYFSDVIVRRDSPFQSFADLRGRTWAFNEPESQSGYGITRYWLARMGETNGYFGKVIQAGFHQSAIRMVWKGKVDAAAIDSQVLAVELARHPELAAGLRVVETLGPSTIQPFTAAPHVSATLQEDVRSQFLALHKDPEGKAWLARGLIDHYVAIHDNGYDDIRHMLSVCESADFMTLK